MKSILFVGFMLIYFDTFTQDPASIKMDSGMFYLANIRHPDPSKNVITKIDSCKFSSIKTVYRDSIVQTIKSEEPFREVFWYNETRYSFYLSDSSFYFKNKKLIFLGIKKDTVLNITAFKYLLDFPPTDDEETTIYFSPEIGVIYFLNYWWFFGKITYSSLLPDLDTYEIDFHEFEEMLNYNNK